MPAREGCLTATDEFVQPIVIPEDVCCESCGDPLGDDVFETADMVVVCRQCWNLGVEETKGESSEGLGDDETRD